MGTCYGLPNHQSYQHNFGTCLEDTFSFKANLSENLYHKIKRNGREKSVGTIWNASNSMFALAKRFEVFIDERSKNPTPAVGGCQARLRKSCLESSSLSVVFLFRWIGFSTSCLRMTSLFVYMQGIASEKAQDQ